MLAWQISRIGMIWLFVAIIVTVAPFLLHLPLWVPGVPLFGLIWRFGIYRGIWGAPGWIVKGLLICVSIAGLGITFNRLYGLEPMASMLICAYGLKLLEIRHRRDALVVVYLGYFVAAVYALFEQSILAGIYLILAYGLITASLAGVHQTAGIREASRPVKKAVTILAQSLPLMVLFFIIMPRLGAFWSVPAPNTAVTGMSDHLAIGDITDLGTSSKTAFRVRFNGETPPRDELYWRGLTFSRFDGKTWRPVSWGFRGGMVKWFGSSEGWWKEDMDVAGEPFSYEVVLERQNGQWLFSLMGSRTLTPDTGVTRTQTLVSMVPVNQRFQYRVETWPEVRFQTDELSDTRRKIELSLPEDVNPQTRAMAREWAGEMPDPESLINRLLEFYRQNFAYTLQPPALGDNAIDEFLNSSRRGFCEHFAASFVFFMRAAGIPSRLVVGYQGGEVHPEEGYLTVRQYDAHAWAEVWLEEKGWVRVDPTAVVAPDRITMGLISMMTAPVVLSETTINLDKYRDVSWINELRLYLDSLDYAWGRWVLGYQNVQSRFLQRLLGRIDFQRVVIFLFGGSVVALLPVMAFALWPQRGKRMHPLDRQYRDFCRAMAKRGCERRVGETPRHFAARCVEAFPDKRREIEAITDCYESSRYGSGQTDPMWLKQLTRALGV